LMFGHFRLGLGNFNHLPPFHVHRRDTVQSSPIPGADHRHMRDHHIRIVHQTARHARMPRLATAFLATALAQTARPWPFGRPVTGGRLMAVVAVSVQPDFEFFDPRPQRGIFARQGLHQREEGFATNGSATTISSRVIITRHHTPEMRPLQLLVGRTAWAVTFNL
jgi:hypothetical protein